MDFNDIDASRVLKFKALSGPLRIKMIPHLSEPHTVKQVADILGMDHHALYHHMRVLEKAGIVELVKTHDTGNITEKYYKLVENWIVMPLLSEQITELQPLVRQSALSIIEDMNLALHSGQEQGTVHRIFLTISDNNILEKKRQINGLIKDFINRIQEIEEKDGKLVYSVNMIHFLMPESIQKK